jgi:hypothetical protein
MNLPVSGQPLFDKEAYYAEVTGIPLEEISAWVSTILGAPDKKEIDDILAMLPQSWMNPTAALNYWQNMNANLGLAGIGDRLSNTDLSNSQSAFVLSGLDSWARSEQANAEEVQDEVIVSYIQSGGQGSPSDTLQALQFLRNSPLLTAVIGAFDPSAVMQAYTIAEQQVVLACLEQWADQQAIFAEQMKGQDKKTDILQTSINSQMLQDYISNVKEGKQNLSAPIVTMLVAGVIGGSSVQLPLTVDATTGVISIDPSKDSLMPAGADFFNPTGAPSQIALSLAQLSANISYTCAYMAIPGAISLFQADPVEVPDAAAKASAYAYAQAISAYVASPDFDTFVKNVILKNDPTLTDDQVNSYIAELTVGLLSNALAAVDKAQMDSSIIRGQDVLDLIDGKAVGNTNPWSLALVKLINEQLDIIQSISPDQSTALRAKMFAYFDMNPNISSLTDPSNAFVTLSDPRLYRQGIITQSTA